MSFECLDCTFSNVAAVHVWRDKLVGTLPIVSDGTAVFGAGFVVEYLVIYSVATGFETFHKPVVSWNTMPVVTSLKRFNENGICVAVIC